MSWVVRVAVYLGGVVSVCVEGFVDVWVGGGV